LTETSSGRWHNGDPGVERIAGWLYTNGYFSGVKRDGISGAVERSGKAPKKGPGPVNDWTWRVTFTVVKKKRFERKEEKKSK